MTLAIGAALSKTTFNIFQRQVFHHLRQFKLKCHPGKCLFFADEMDFLGHKILGKGIALQDEKTRAIQDMPAPKDIHQLRAALGLFSYYFPNFTIVNLYQTSPVLLHHSMEFSKVMSNGTEATLKKLLSNN